MILVVPIKLRIEAAHKAAFAELLARLNAACYWLSQQAFDIQLFGKGPLQKRFYLDLRARFNLQAQQAIRVIAKVADAYKTQKTLLKKRNLAAIARHQKACVNAAEEGKPLPPKPVPAILACCTFERDGSFPYDARLYALWPDEQEVSVAGPDGKRVKLAYHVAQAQRPLLADKGRLGEADLVLKRGKLFLYVSVEIDDEPALDTHNILGVDLGVKNLAVDSDDNTYSGKQVEKVRRKYHNLRRSLQKRGTSSSRRALRSIACKEARFRTIENHRIANSIVATAQGTSPDGTRKKPRTIALENLSGITGRVTVGRAYRATLMSWAFWQLRQFIAYKAKANCIALILVNPENTSRTCPCCTHVAKANRPTRDDFRCVKCGFDGPADLIAAINISTKAAVNRLSVPSKVSRSATTRKISQVQTSLLSDVAHHKAPSFRTG